MSEFRFYHPIEVRYGDLDPQGHLNNAKYLTYFETGPHPIILSIWGFSRRDIPLWILASSWQMRVSLSMPLCNMVRPSRLGCIPAGWEQIHDG